jgi:nitroreductase
MISKTIDTAVPILPVFASRYSGVSYDSQRPVSHEQLLALTEAARWAPSCFGDQPWRYLICDRFTEPQAWEKAFSCLAEGNQAWCTAVPVLLLSCADSRFARNDKPNRFGAHDTGAASFGMCLQAASMGLMTHQMGGFDAEKISSLFSIPERYQPMAMMAVGYQLPEERLPEQFRDKELAPRARNPLARHFFLGSWETGLPSEARDQ